MINFSDLRDVHLEITNQCQAGCPMCPRNVHGGLPNPLIKNQAWTLEDFKTIMSEAVLKQISGFYLCGNYGDPILNTELLPMLEYAVDVNPNLFIRMHTNGSARTVDFWESLAQVLRTGSREAFGLDGASDTHELYRIGTKFDTVIKNAKAFINAGGAAEWAFIRFKHNQHEVDAARQMSTELGFHMFTVKDTARFYDHPEFAVYDKAGNTTHHLESPSDTTIKLYDKEAMLNFKAVQDTAVIDCKAAKDREIFIDAYKNVYPCCWVGAVPFIHTVKDTTLPITEEMHANHVNLIQQFGGYDNINALLHSVEDIVNSSTYQTIWADLWENHAMLTCATHCRKRNHSI